MKDRPKLHKIETGRNFSDIVPGFFPVVTISSDGRNFNIEIAEHCIPAFTQEVLDKMTFILTDSIYRLRPDLRKQ